MVRTRRKLVSRIGFGVGISIGKVSHARSRNDASPSRGGEGGGRGVDHKTLVAYRFVPFGLTGFQ